MGLRAFCFSPHFEARHTLICPSGSGPFAPQRIPGEKARFLSGETQRHRQLTTGGYILHLALYSAHLIGLYLLILHLSQSNTHTRTHTICRGPSSPCPAVCRREEHARFYIRSRSYSQGTSINCMPNKKNLQHTMLRADCYSNQGGLDVFPRA